MTDDTTFGLRHGVIYEASPRSLSPWARNVNDRNQYDQNYGQFVMLTVPDDDDGYFAGQSWMIDTYHFDIPGVRTREGLNREDSLIAQVAERDFVSSWTIGHLKGNCYYNACVRLDERNAGLFTEVCDLRDYAYVSDEDAADYEEDDLVHGIHLYREHGYFRFHGDCGVILRRKGAEKSPVRQAQAMRSRMRRERPRYDGWSYLYRAEELERFAYEHQDREDVLAVLALETPEIEFGRRVRDEWHEFCDDFDRNRSHDQMRLFSYDDEGNVVVGGEQGDE